MNRLHTFVFSLFNFTLATLFSPLFETQKTDQVTPIVIDFWGKKPTLG